eukprot:1154789-Pelagomonas_calceolata.AAC.2
MGNGKIFGSKSLSKLLKAGKPSSQHQANTPTSEGEDEDRGSPRLPAQPPHPGEPSVARCNPHGGSCPSEERKEKPTLDIQSAVSRALGVFLPPNTAAGRINKVREGGGHRDTEESLMLTRAFLGCCLLAKHPNECIKIRR